MGLAHRVDLLYDASRPEQGSSQVGARSYMQGAIMALPQFSYSTERQHSKFNFNN